MDRLEAMSILIAAVESGSLSAASRKLNFPLPTISRKVAELEEHLKTRLLTRSTRKLTLTDAGAAYLAACKVILEYVDDAISSLCRIYCAAGGNVARAFQPLVPTTPIVAISNDPISRSFRGGWFPARPKCGGALEIGRE